MAVMYPKSLEHLEKPNVGERKVFHFIRQAAVPHKDYICWFEPMIGEIGKEPDFGVTSVTYDRNEILRTSTKPR